MGQCCQARRLRVLPKYARAKVTTDLCSSDLGGDARRCSFSGGELLFCPVAETGRDERPDCTGGAAGGVARRGRRGAPATTFAQRGGAGKEDLFPSRCRFPG